MTAAPRSGRARRSAGFSAIEMTIVIAILVALATAVITITSSALDAFRSTTAGSDLDIRAQRCLDGLVDELLVAAGTDIASMPATPSWQSSVTFDRVASIDNQNGLVSWQTVRVEWQPDPGDPSDGVDNDGDGLVDEGFVALVIDPSGTPVTVNVCTAVRRYLAGEVPNGLDDNGNGLIDESGFCVERVGNTLTLRLTLERVGLDGERVSRTVETSVTPRD